MRRQSRKLAVSALLLMGGLYFIWPSSLPVAEPESSTQHDTTVDLSWVTERSVTKVRMDHPNYMPFNVSYELLAGAPSLKKRYLSIGISSVKRNKGSYLIPTLQSLFSQSSSEERSSMVVVLLLADFDQAWKIATMNEIKKEFPLELEQGQLVVIHVPQEWYPQLTGLKRNYNDSPQRVSFRSKQNVDYSYLIHYSANLAQYYLQLEDDVASARNFFTTIRRHVATQETRKGTWAMLEFSTLGYIGKLYKSSDLPLLARFLFLFYQEMPCDWLMSHFRVLLVQKDTIIFKPSLFQHMGTFSSFEGTFNKLKDKDFVEPPFANPVAQVYSNMSAYNNHLPELAWTPGEKFFWAHSPRKGDHLTVVLDNPAVVTMVLVETGSGGKDLLESARVELGHGVITLKNREKTCKDFLSVGVLSNGRFEKQNVDKQLNSASSCLRIQVTAEQKDWVIITAIRITTKGT